MKLSSLIFALTFVPLSLIPWIAQAQTRIGFNRLLGEPLHVGLRAEAMGGTRIASGVDVQSANDNPAMLVRLTGTTLEISGRLSSLDASVDDRRLDRQMSGWQPRSLSIAHSTPLFGGPLTFAFGYQRPESRTTVIDKENQENSRQDGFFGGVGFEPATGVWLGVSASHLLADFSRETSLFQSGTWSDFVHEQRMRATLFRLGILFDLNRGETPLPLQIGVSIRPQTEMKLESNIGVSEETAQMPLVLSTGFAWEPFPRFRAALDIDYYQISGRRIYDDYADRLISRGNRDMACIRFGVEKIFLISKGHLALRAGLHTFPTLEADYSDGDVSGSPVYGFGYTSGAGLRIGRAELNLSIVHLDRYKAEYPIPTGGCVLLPAGPAYQWDYHAFSIGFSYHFRVIDPENVVWKRKQPGQEKAVED